MLTFFKSKLLVLGAGCTTKNDQECQHVMGRFESIKMLFTKPVGWPTFVQSYPSAKTRLIQKTSVTIGREKISDLRKSWGIAPQDRMDVRIQSQVL